LDLEKIRDAAERVARSEGLEIFDVEWKVGKQRFLRVIIDRPPKAGASMSDSAGQILAPSEAREGGQLGVSHADCQRVSQQLSVILDVEELILGPGYTLEVSSPGMDRALRKPAEYERFRGRMAKISTTEPVEDEKYFEGRLAGFVDGNVRLELKGKTPRTVEVPLEKIRKANLMVEF
jgi:ribosome maturation factor RimP